MFGRLLSLLDSIRSSLWFWPVVMSVVALLLAQGTVRIDRSDWLEQMDLTWLFGAGIVGARTMLATIATAMITIAATVFSVTIVVLSLAAGQMGPRLLRTFMRDRGMQMSLSVFIATFAFCISVLGVVDGSSKVAFVPRASVSTALLLGLISMAVLIYFIHHVAAAIQAPNVIAVVGEELDDAIDRLFPEEVGSGDAALATEVTSALPPDFPVASSAVLAPKSGYVQLVNGSALVRIARAIDGLIWLARAPGGHVLAGTEIARVWPGSANGPEVNRQIQDAFSIGATRTPVQDVLYLVRQIVEIAQRALSPSINDPTTAEACLNRLGIALAKLLQRRMPSSFRRDDDGALRLIVQGASFRQFVSAAFDPIRNYSASSLQVSLHMASLITELAPLTRQQNQRDALLVQAQMLERAAAELPEMLDREAVEAQCRCAIDALDLAAQSLAGAAAGLVHAASADFEKPVVTGTPAGPAINRASAVAAPLLVGLLAATLAIPLAPAYADDVGITSGTANDSANQSTTPSATIAVESTERRDAEISNRLLTLYKAMDDLRGVAVSVDGGVVVLSGDVPSRAAHDQAVALARRIESVVDVQDRIVESRDVQGRLSTTVDHLRDQFTNLVGLLPLLGVALLIFAIFWWLARLGSGSRLFGRTFRGNPFLRDLVRQVVRLAIIGMGLVLALQILDATAILTTLLGAAGVVGLALGFALRDTVENYIASLLLSLRQPFASNDHVVIEGCEGRVLRLTPRATILMTLDGNHTRIPNAKVYKAVIVNYTRNPKRRFMFDVGVDTEQSLADAQELAARTLLKMEGVLDDPAPYCTVETLGDSNVVLRVFGWVDQRSADFLRVRSEAIRLVKLAFDEAGIVMPEPIYNVRMRTLPAAIATGAATISASKHPVAAENEEPTTAIDIEPQDDLDAQIAADRSAGGEDDLLSANARKE
ncbi:MAG: DUF2254 family protein [Gammaproteobacteria bacterium]